MIAIMFLLLLGYTVGSYLAAIKTKAETLKVKDLPAMNETLDIAGMGDEGWRSVWEGEKE